MSEVKKCCKNCNARSHIWCLYTPYHWLNQEELEQERECEKFSPSLSAIADATDGNLQIVVDDNFIKELKNE